MCFIISKDPTESEPKIATQDITCYKRMAVGKGLENKYYSCPRAVRYKLGKLYKNKRFVKQARVGDTAITKGRHSYTDLAYVMRMQRHGEGIVECIIPKGTEYYVNTANHEYVSLAIIPMKLAVTPMVFG